MVEIAPGVTEIPHTADLALSVEADSLEALFGRAAVGMFALLWDCEMGEGGAGGEGAASGKDGGSEEKAVQLTAEDVALLLVRWLRELLHLAEMEGFVYRDAVFDQLDERHLRARVRGGVKPGRPHRDIKGVTYHGLRVDAAGSGWSARVIFDV